MLAPTNLMASFAFAVLLKSCGFVPQETKPQETDIYSCRNIKKNNVDRLSDTETGYIYYSSARLRRLGDENSEKYSLHFLEIDGRDKDAMVSDIHTGRFDVKKAIETADKFCEKKGYDPENLDLYPDSP